MAKHESRYYNGPYMGQEKLNQTAINILNDELNINGIDAVDRIYATVVQRAKFEMYKKQGIYPTIGKCLCKLKYRQCKGLCQGKAGILDHGELWYKDNKPYKYVAQPYVLDGRDFESLRRCCEEHGFTYKVFGDSFHFSGATFLIEIMNNFDVNQ
ncbi:hypothetical protein [Staphylococcus nepalensis]|uniref:hypothetical protein n=1 Tax=Staphylococcus nepalensis TaxID=214473 RepID=UPI001A994C56|nr:hypothetical protein [Staphylococcus nepalensis]MBO1220474.1 hypothetical protein [Staphylococcus nepalensis]